jgi:peptidoglycan/xylan/chitin deacetylase (PgdA/CDA1 family)
LTWRLRGRTPRVVAYHRVVPDFDSSVASSLPAMLTSAPTFERHLDWLGGHFDLVSLDDLERRPNGRRRRAAAITFDDGYLDVYENAVPLLVRKGIPAAMFVSSAFVGTRGLYLHDRLLAALARAWEAWPDAPRAIASRLPDAGAQRAVRRRLDRGKRPVDATPELLETIPRGWLVRIVDGIEAELGRPDPSRFPPVMGWAELADLVRAGFTIGSHTRHHVLLPLERPEVVRDEVAGSREELERALGIPIRHFAYPNGGFDAASARAVAGSGYLRAYTTCRHRDSRYPDLTVPRKVLWEKTCLDPRGRFSPAMMSCQVHGVFDRARCAHAS